MRRANGEPYSYFTCYGYSKGKCVKPNGISSNTIEQEVISCIKNALDTKRVEYELREYKPAETVNECALIEERLSNLKGKEDRIRASYREGIDTIDEYRENRALIQKERETLEHQLAELKTPKNNHDQKDPVADMLRRIKSVYEILLSDSYTYVQKNEALKQIIDKIVYDKSSETLKIYYFLYQ